MTTRTVDLRDPFTRHIIRVDQVATIAAPPKPWTELRDRYDAFLEFDAHRCAIGSSRRSSTAAPTMSRRSKRLRRPRPSTSGSMSSRRCAVRSTPD
jgi:hypothetical protein